MKTSLRKKTFKNVKNGFRASLKSTETRKSQPCPLRIGWVLAKSYGDLFYTPKSLPHFLLLAKKILLTARLFAKFSLTARLLAKFSFDSKAMI